MFLSSLFFALLAKLTIGQTVETFSPQTFSVTAAVLAPAVVICLNSLPSSLFLQLKTSGKSLIGYSKFK